MKKYLIIYALLVTGALLFTLRHYRSQTRRLVQNQEALTSDLTRYRTRAGQEAATAQVLRLRCAEFERLREADAEEIRRLGIRLRRLEATSKTATATQLEIRVPIRDSLVIRRDTDGVPPPADGVHPEDRPDTARRSGAAGNPLESQPDTTQPRGVSAKEPLATRHSVTKRPGSAAGVQIDTLRGFRWEDPWTVVEGRLRNDSVTCRIRSVDTLRQIVHRIPRRFLFIRWGTKALRQEIVSSNPHTRIVYAEYIRLER